MPQTALGQLWHSLSDSDFWLSLIAPAAVHKWHISVLGEWHCHQLKHQCWRICSGLFYTPTLSWLSGYSSMQWVSTKLTKNCQFEAMVFNRIYASLTTMWWVWGRCYHSDSSSRSWCTSSWCFCKITEIINNFLDTIITSWTLLQIVKHKTWQWH